eukprot:GFUD01094411.1.p1 GENE.GFUD01094411.1~~GFUD01094411.1.p1  ORF type:complete len:788 (+),score=167.37 GFUD01094411.1:28-2391(+)
MPRILPVMVWLFLLTFHVVAAGERQIFINLIPRGYQDPRMDKDFVCGFDQGIDSERLIGEQNSMFIFELLDKTRDTTEGYKTRIYDVVTFGRDEQAEVMLDTLQCPVDESMPGLLSLFLVPPKHQCNSRTFEDAKDSQFGYYPVFVGVSVEDAIIQKFISEAQNFKPFYNGQMPKLCGSKLTLNNETAHARVETVSLLFNIKYNAGQTRNLDPTKWKICESVEQSIEAMEKSDLFEVDPEMSFENENQTISETDGFVRAGIIRKGPLAKKAVGFVATSFPTAGGPYSPAGEDDIVTYKGPVVFNKNEENSSILIRVKEDDKTENIEYFFLEIQDSMVMKQHRRRKRSPGKGGDPKGKGGKGTTKWVAKETVQVETGQVETGQGGKGGQDKGKKGKGGQNKGKGKGGKNTIAILDISLIVPPTPPFKCIDNENGEWHWTKENKANNQFVQEWSPIHFYELMTKQQEDIVKERSNIPVHLSWDNRCRKTDKHERTNTLQKSMGSWMNPKTNAVMLAKAAVKILDRVVWYGITDVRANAVCPKMMEQTVSIAMMTPKDEVRKHDIYIAGNLAKSFGTKNNPLKVKMMLSILDEHLGDTYQDVFVINPSAQTFGQGNSKSHAEMQLAKVAMTKKLKVHAIGVSKPPCCACNIVLRSVFSDKSKEQSTTNFYEAVDYHEMLQDVPVASAKGSERCNIKPDQGGKTEEWCGSQYTQKDKDGWPDFNRFWEHPKHVDGWTVSKFIAVTDIQSLTKRAEIVEEEQGSEQNSDGNGQEQEDDDEEPKQISQGMDGK